MATEERDQVPAPPVATNGTTHPVPKPTLPEDRLPTVSATQLLSPVFPPLSTGLHALDNLLSPKAPGLTPGSITELWGPSGSGKTTLALSLASSAQSVTWLDLSSPLTRKAPRYHHLALPSLPHLLAYLSRPRPAHLLVIDNLSAALDVGFPREGVGRGAKRAGVLGWIAGLLRRGLAGGTLGAVVVVSGASTRSMGGGGAVCVSALGGGEWERAVGQRIVLFRDVGGRFVGVTKMGGREVAGDGEVGFVVPFAIEEGSIVDVTGADTDAVPQCVVSPVRETRKRKFGEEVADSESDGDYGWDDGDGDEVIVAAEGLVDEDEITPEDTAGRAG